MHVVRVRPKTHPAKLKVTSLTVHVHASSVFIDCNPAVWTCLACCYVSKVTQVLVKGILVIALIEFFPLCLTNFTFDEVFTFLINAHVRAPYRRALLNVFRMSYVHFEQPFLEHISKLLSRDSLENFVKRVARMVTRIVVALDSVLPIYNS